MNATRSEALKGWVTASERMLALAESGDWAQLTELAAERHRELEHFFTVAVRADEAEEVRFAIEQVQRIDTVLETLCTEERRKAGAAVRRQRRGSRAVRAYQAGQHR